MIRCLCQILLLLVLPLWLFFKVITATGTWRVKTWWTKQLVTRFCTEQKENRHPQKSSQCLNFSLLSLIFMVNVEKCNYCPFSVFEFVYKAFLIVVALYISIMCFEKMFKRSSLDKQRYIYDMFAVWDGHN